MTDFLGCLRYNLFTERFQPFIKAGYGWTWYRLKNMKVGDTTLEEQHSQWFHRPLLFRFLPSRFPDSWHFGIGVEYLPLIKYGYDWTNLDIGVKLQYELTSHKLGKELEDNPTVTRQFLTLSITISF